MGKASHLNVKISDHDPFAFLKRCLDLKKTFFGIVTSAIPSRIPPVRHSDVAAMLPCAFATTFAAGMLERPCALNIVWKMLLGRFGKHF